VCQNNPDIEATMVFRRTESLRAITDALGRIIHACALQGLLRLFDDHVQAQHFFCRLLNAIYGLQLQEMDQIQANYPAIDLGDPTNRVAYQITADKGGDKIQQTLNGFVNHGLQASYDTLKILVVGDRQATYKTVKVPEVIQFDCDTDVMGIADLVRHLNTLPSPRLEEVEAILNQELVPTAKGEQQVGLGLMSGAQDFLAVACDCEGADKGKMVLTFDGSGWILTCGNRTARFPHTDRPAQASCRAALDQLLERKLIADSGLKPGPGGNLLGWYAVQHAGYLLREKLLNQRRAAAKGGSVNISGNLSAGSGKEGLGGHIVAEGGTGRRGASGGDVNVGPGNHKAGDGGQGPGGKITLKGGDAE
jgi:hypothetical protein